MKVSLIVAAVSAVLTLLFATPLYVLAAGATLFLGFGGIDNAFLSSLAAILVCALMGLPAAMGAFVLRWMDTDARRLSLLAILLASAAGMTVAAGLMNNGTGIGSTTAKAPLAWRPMLVLAQAFARGIKDGHGEQIAGLAAGASTGAFLASLWRKRAIGEK